MLDKVPLLECKRPGNLEMMLALKGFCLQHHLEFLFIAEPWVDVDKIRATY